MTIGQCIKQWIATNRFMLIGLAIISIVGGYFVSRGDAMNFIFFDDSLYYRDIVKHTHSLFIPSADGVNPATGYHPLWLIILFIFNIFGLPGLTLPLVSASAVVLCSFAVWFKVFRRLHGDMLGMAFSLLMHLYPTTLIILFCGMETPTVLMAIGLIFLYADRPFSKAFGWSMAIAVMARTDMVVILTPLLVYNAWLQWNFTLFRKRPEIKLFKYWLLPIGAISLFGLYNFIVSGSPLQGSLGIYAWLYWSEINSIQTYADRVYGGLWNITSNYDNWHGHIIFFIVPFVMLWKQKIYPWFWLVLGSLAIVAISIFIRFSWAVWYLIPLYAMFMYGLVYLYREHKKLFILILSGMLVIQIPQYIFLQGKYNSNVHYWGSHNRPLDQLKIAKKFTDHKYPYKFGAFNSGEFGYFQDSVVNLDGLVNTEIMKHYKDGSIMQYLREQRVFVLADAEQYFIRFHNIGIFPLDSFYLIGTEKDTANHDEQPTRFYIMKRCPVGWDYGDSIVEKARRLE